jgi:hypothetical protein
MRDAELAETVIDAEQARISSERDRPPSAVPPGVPGERQPVVLKEETALQPRQE